MWPLFFGDLGTLAPGAIPMVRRALAHGARNPGNPCIDLYALAPAKEAAVTLRFCRPLTALPDLGHVLRTHWIQTPGPHEATAHDAGVPSRREDTSVARARCLCLCLTRATTTRRDTANGRRVGRALHGVAQGSFPCRAQLAGRAHHALPRASWRDHRHRVARRRRCGALACLCAPDGPDSFLRRGSRVCIAVRSGG